MSLNFSTFAIWVLKLLATVIMLQTLYFKFAGAPESIYIFSTLDMEPWGRIGIGVMELIASVLILYPKTTGIGAALGAGLMSGALYFHFTKLGIVVQDDGGQLFIYALIVFLSCVSLLIIYRKQLLGLVKLNFRVSLFLFAGISSLFSFGCVTHFKVQNIGRPSTVDRRPKVQECDATVDAKRTKAGLIKFIFQTMKKILIITCIAAIFAACGKQNATPTNRLNEMVDTANASLLLSGVFMNGPHGEVMGTANIYVKDSMYTLALKDFNSSNGPALHVYLSQEIQPEHFIDLGNLKSTNGNQVYDVPSGTDFKVYKYALIHCQEYNHLFGSSALQ